jgi:hypothetical protein
MLNGGSPIHLTQRRENKWTGGVGEEENGDLERADRAVGDVEICRHKMNGRREDGT